MNEVIFSYVLSKSRSLRKLYSCKSGHVSGLDPRINLPDLRLVHAVDVRRDVLL
eukprot:COSAG05_NODE_20722_length_277_cov_0.848315_1_plen_53_part_10